MNYLLLSVSELLADVQSPGSPPCDSSHHRSSSDTSPRSSGSPPSLSSPLSSSDSPQLTDGLDDSLLASPTGEFTGWTSQQLFLNIIVCTQLT